jgi:hypothetical protein
MPLHNRLCNGIFQIFQDGSKMASGPVTLEQVAQAAGVSPSTASRALAGKARQCRISAKTELAILKAAKGLGFQASHVARSLRTQRTGLIGLLVPDASNPFFAAIARKATIFAERHGFSILLDPVGGQPRFIGARARPAVPFEIAPSRRPHCLPHWRFECPLAIAGTQPHQCCRGRPVVSGTTADNGYV